MQKQGLDAVLVSPGKSVDGRLIFDVLVNAHDDTFDTAIIASGDRDYIPVVEQIKKLHKEVKIASFSANLGPGLKAVADGNILCLEDHASTIAQKTYGYQCSQCGCSFVRVYKLYPDQMPPRCNICYKKTATVKAPVTSPVSQQNP